jgi:hypothetical protein
MERMNPTMNLEASRRSVARALTIAGSDSSGGAGIQADLKTFQELGVYGMSAITAVTAQNTLGVQAVYPLSPEAVARQVHAVGSDIGIDAVKTGMLFSSEIILAVAEVIRTFGWTKVVVDPVMVAKGGSVLLQEEAIRALTRSLPVLPFLPERIKRKRQGGSPVMAHVMLLSKAVMMPGRKQLICCTMGAASPSWQAGALPQGIRMVRAAPFRLLLQQD